MRGFNEVLDDIANIIESTDSVPIKCVKEYRGDYMDMPLNDPTVTLGINNAVMNMGALGAYGGLRGSVGETSAVTTLEVKANIHIPKTHSGYICYDVLTIIADALFSTSLLDVTKIESGNMHYKSTFLCNVLPVSIHLRERMCGNTE